MYEGGTSGACVPSEKVKLNPSYMSNWMTDHIPQILNFNWW